MKTDFDYPSKNLLGTVVFRKDFNNFEKITVSQAWSLFFTAGKEDKALGYESELGLFFSNLLIAIAVSGSLWASVFTRIA
ncbi:MAG: hypothetical protein VKN72_11570 [Nostocales cyanobacterium 94392]|nr:hypothetical protein [Nostocales cyanobacterium 94392]